MFDLINEILTFGPKIAHDDTIRAFIANTFFPPNEKGLEKELGLNQKEKAKSWLVS